MRCCLQSATVGVLAGAVLAVAPAASGHGGTRSVGYVSTFSYLDPNVLGVSINVFGSKNTISLTNYSGKTVVVEGRAGEPYLRFAPGHVDENVRAPTTFLNGSRQAPAAARPGARPRWRKVARGSSYAWHDHRIVWTGTQPPPVVRQAPEVPHLVFRWAIPASADGRRFLIRGFLGWAPPPKEKRGTNWWAVAAAAGGGTVALATLALGLRARRRVGRRAL
jgi:hypothetical protein